MATGLGGRFLRAPRRKIKPKPKKLGEKRFSSAPVLSLFDLLSFIICDLRLEATKADMKRITSDDPLARNRSLLMGPRTMHSRRAKQKIRPFGGIEYMRKSTILLSSQSTAIS
jgi:hypothetical protein